MSTNYLWRQRILHDLNDGSKDKEETDPLQKQKQDGTIDAILNEVRACDDVPTMLDVIRKHIDKQPPDLRQALVLHLYLSTRGLKNVNFAFETILCEIKYNLGSINNT